MADLADFFVIVILIMVILNAGSPFIRFAIRLYAIQSWALALYTLTEAIPGIAALYVSSAVTLAIKGILIPWLLMRTFRQVETDQEFQSSIGHATSVLIAGGLVVVASILTSLLMRTSLSVGHFVFTVALATFLIGAMLMVTRRLLLSQVLSFLIIENAIFLAASSVNHGMPLLVELGILFDLLVGVLLAVILVFHIQRSFSEMSMDEQQEAGE